ncbi:MAG TPA: TolC family protein [Terriglobia bacterium]|nr:TolC family protein [Terriglobia bacterium]
MTERSSRIFLIARLVAVLGLFGARLGFAQASSNPAPQALTLKQAEEIALKGHPQVQAAQLSALAAGQVVTETKSAYYPFTYGSLTGAGAESASRIAAGVLNNPIIYNRYANGVTVNQLVTDFGRTSNLVASSRFHAQAEQQNAQATREDVLLSVDYAYYQALRAQALLTVADETVKERQLVADQVSELAKNRLKSGLDVSFANVNLEQAKLTLVSARNDVSAAFAQLSTALGYQDNRTYSLAEEPMPGAPPPDASDLVAQAIQGRPELASLRYASESARRFAKAERDLWLPSVSFAGAAGVTPWHQEQLTDRYAAAGLNVNIPIFNGRLYSARAAEARLRAEAADENLRDEADRVARDVRLAWLNANTAYQRLGLTAQLLDEASQALDLAQTRYKLGLGSIVELSQAQLNQTQAQTENAGAKYDYQISRADLDYQTGVLH